MPIYEYQCQQCKHQFEAIRKITDEPLTVCPACGRPTLKKLISKAAFRLKGGGWYETDFKSKGKRNVAGEHGEAAQAKSDASSSDAKSKGDKKAGASDSSATSGSDKSTKKSSDSTKASATKSSD